MLLDIKLQILTFLSPILNPEEVVIRTLVCQSDNLLLEPLHSLIYIVLIFFGLLLMHACIVHHNILTFSS